jgi:hypothetical protein
MPLIETAMRNRTIVPWLLLPVLTFGLTTTEVRSSVDPAALCTKAARAAAKQAGVPYDVLLAISVVETGRDLRPWPWTVNLGGEGHWLDSKAEAEVLVQTALDEGRTNIDIGCFQLNLRWHASAFSSIEEMLDPDRNALYAAGYLAEMHARTGDWTQAAAAYHSATPEHAERYGAQYEKTVAALAGDPSEPAPAVDRPVNGFPLLTSGAPGSNGSLVPVTSGGLRLFGGP